MTASDPESQAASRPTIVVVGLSFPYRGGISHYSTLFVRQLRQKFNVRFITLSRQYPSLLFPGTTQYDSSDKRLEEPNERLIDSINPLTWVRTARAIRKARPSLVVIQWWHPFFAFAFGSIKCMLGRELRRKTVFLCHNVLPHEGSPLQKTLSRFAFFGSNLFIVHSSQDRQQLLDLRGDAKIRQGLHPTYAEFSDSHWSRSTARTDLGIAADEKVILFFGLVRKYKGLQYLIEAMGRVLDELDCKLLIVGEFYDDKQPYLDLIESQRIGGSVRVVDQYVPNEDVPKYFLAADVVVLPYVSATQSGIVQIAFGIGTPVITTNVGGLPEAVDDGETGYIVESQSCVAIADAIIRYFCSDADSKFRAAIRRQNERFDWDHEIRFIEEFLQEANRQGT